MDDKVINLHEASNEEALPPNQETILKNLQSVNDEWHSEYLKVVENYLEELIICRNIIASRRNPNLFRHLVSTITAEQLNRLQLLSMDLASIDPLEKLEAIVEATFQFTPPTQKGLSMSNEIVSMIRSLNPDYKEKAKEMGEIARRMKLLATTLTLVGLDFDEYARGKLSHSPEKDLDFLREAILMAGHLKIN